MKPFAQDQRRPKRTAELVRQQRCAPGEGRSRVHRHHRQEPAWVTGRVNACTSVRAALQCSSVPGEAKQTP